MYTRTLPINKLKDSLGKKHQSTDCFFCRATELARKVGNVMEGRRSGIVSDAKASLLLAELAKGNADLVLQEQEDPDVKEAMRGVRIALLPFADGSF